jgi:MFS family permease
MDGREWRFAVTISGAHGMDHLLKRVFPPLVPIWAVAFGFPLWKLGLILGARTFGSAVGQAPMGHLSDQFDRRGILPSGIALEGVGFLLLAALPLLGATDAGVSVGGTPVSWQFLGMLVAMLVVGFGSSVLHPTGYPLISENVSEVRKGKVLGMWGSARAFGDGSAPALVGVALLLTGWRPIVAGFGLLGLAYAGYLWVVLGSFETRPAEQVDDHADPAADGDSLLGGDRRRYLYPMLAVFAAFVLQIVATTGANVFLPEFITSEYSYTLAVAGVEVTAASTASFYYSALLLTAGVVQLGTGELIDRYDHRAVLLGFLATASVVLLAVATVSFSPPVLLAVLLLLGASLWGLNPARDAIVSDIAPPEGEGRTFGYLWTGTLLLASGSPAVIGYIGDVAGLRQAFAVLAGVVFLSMVPIALLLSDRVYLEAARPADGRAD